MELFKSNFVSPIINKYKARCDVIYECSQSTETKKDKEPNQFIPATKKDVCELDKKISEMLDNITTKHFKQQNNQPATKGDLLQLKNEIFQKIEESNTKILDKQTNYYTLQKGHINDKFDNDKFYNDMNWDKTLLDKFILTVKI